jgi:hypothetical protein
VYAVYVDRAGDAGVVEPAQLTEGACSNLRLLTGGQTSHQLGCSDFVITRTLQM